MPSKVSPAMHSKKTRKTAWPDAVPLDVARQFFFILKKINLITDH